jgi:hypothetical protein
LRHYQIERFGGLVVDNRFRQRDFQDPYHFTANREKVTRFNVWSFVVCLLSHEQIFSYPAVVTITGDRSAILD